MLKNSVDKIMNIKCTNKVTNSTKQIYWLKETELK